MMKNSPSSPASIEVAPPPSYSIPSTFAKQIADIPKSQHGCYEGLMSCLGYCLGWLGVYLPCFGCWHPFKTVPQGAAGIVSKFGKAVRVVDPGLYFVNRCTEHIVMIDVKIRLSDIPSQFVMTRDNVNLEIDSVVYWHVIDPFVAKFHVTDVENALTERTMTTLRDTIGAHDLQEAITNREKVAREIKTIIDATARTWGVVVEAILIKDLRFSKDLQENLSSAAKQKRIGESKIIAAEAEVSAARLMREASDILNTPAAMQIRYLETLQAMSRNGQTKVIFMPLTDHNQADMNNILTLESNVDNV